MSHSCEDFSVFSAALAVAVSVFGETSGPGSKNINVLTQRGKSCVEVCFERQTDRRCGFTKCSNQQMIIINKSEKNNLKTLV